MQGKFIYNRWVPPPQKTPTTKTSQMPKILSCLKPIIVKDTLALPPDDVHFCILEQQSQRKTWHMLVLFSYF